MNQTGWILTKVQQNRVKERSEIERNAKISATQVAFLLFILVTSTLLIFVPAITAKEAKQSAWLTTVLIPFIAGYITLWVIYKLGRYFPKLTIFQYCEIILGKFLGKCLAAAFIVYLLVVNILVIREFSDFLNITTLPLTPRLWLVISIIVVATYGAYKGIEVIARASQFILSPYFVIFIICIALVIMDFKLGRLLPIMEEGILPIIRGSIAPTAWYSEICMLAMLFPFVNKPAEIKRKGTIALVAITLFVTMDVAVTIGVLGAKFTSLQIFPFWALIKSIEIREIIQRIEVFVLVIWITGILIKAALVDYLICLGITQVFGLGNTNVILIITAVFQVAVATIVLGNTPQMQVILSSYWPPFGIIFGFVLPISLLIVTRLRKRLLGGLKR